MAVDCDPLESVSASSGKVSSNEVPIFLEFDLFFEELTRYFSKISVNEAGTAIAIGGDTPAASVTVAPPSSPTFIPTGPRNLRMKKNKVNGIDSGFSGGGPVRL